MDMIPTTAPTRSQRRSGAPSPNLMTNRAPAVSRHDYLLTPSHGAHGADRTTGPIPHDERTYSGTVQIFTLI